VAQVRPLYWPAPYQDSVSSGRLILRDGTTANIRVAQPEGREALRAFFAQLSPDSKLLDRLFTTASHRPRCQRHGARNSRLSPTGRLPGT
jgi:hypothetical protein